MRAMVYQITGNSAVQHLRQVDKNKSVKLRITDPLWMEFTGYRWCPFTKCHLRDERFHVMPTIMWRITGAVYNRHNQIYET